MKKVSELEFDEMLEWTTQIFTKIKNIIRRVRVIKGWTVFG